MPAQRISVPHDRFTNSCARHDSVAADLSKVEPRLQRYVAELIMMRVFDEFQEGLSGVASRLACGTPYADGTVPSLLTTPARSTAGAVALFQSHGRPKPVSLRWSKVKFINEATKHVLDPSEPFLSACAANSVIIAEMQAVRNRIAHKNASSGAAFAPVVQRHYGARLNNVTPGLLLISDRFSPTLLQTYLASCRVILKTCARV